MESKIATYTELNVRLQLVRIIEGSVCTFVIRYNRRVISRTYTREEALLARLYFSHMIAMICVDRNPIGLSKMTM